MKKLFAFTLALALMLSMTACGGNANKQPSSSEDSTYEDVLGEDSSIEDQQPSTDEEEGNEETTPPTDDEQETKPDSKPDNNKPSNGGNSKPDNSGSNKPSNGGNGSNSGSNGGSGSNTGSGSQDETKTYSGTLPDLINAIYANHSVDLSLSDPTAVDLSNSDQISYYLGLTDASKLKEAYYSEALIGSQAYSLVVVRANSAKDAASVAQSMFDGINQNKWICVTANAVAAGAYGDTAMLVMANTDLGETLTTDLRAAYASAVGGALDVSLDRVDTL